MGSSSLSLCERMTPEPSLSLTSLIQLKMALCGLTQIINISDHILTYIICIPLKKNQHQHNFNITPHTHVLPELLPLYMDVILPACFSFSSCLQL